MKFSSVAFFAAVASAAAIDEAANLRDILVCNADNCLRAVRATRFGTATMSARMAECSSFLAVTETPKASTVFVTESSIQTVTVNSTRTLFQRQAAETPASSTTKVIPEYASACPNAAGYSSACLCFGATAATTTAPAATVTSTVTVVATTTLGPYVNVTRPAVTCGDPWRCGSGKIPACSGSESSSGCVCFRTVEGRQVCAQPNDCEPGCNTSSDCSGGEVCIKDSCCAGGTCMKIDVCLNDAQPKMMFKRRSAAWVKKQARAGFNRLSLVPHEDEVERA
ncbi:hypothetical protein LX36DRAFT_672917 [Colletotrichum falcatum]|nr:hypothetical protein LX36DRAFT_672917 [Colletotrichum falcatum]